MHKIFQVVLWIVMNPPQFSSSIVMVKTANSSLCQMFFFFFSSVLQSLIIFSTQNILCYSCLLSLQQLSTSYLHTNMWFRGFIRLDIDVMTAIVLCYSLLIIWRCLMQQKCCVVLGGITLVSFMIKMHSTC